ncbi:MAG: crossover junction endodeoxyribonuclease RuvC [Candidatus Schekmanbacteria bacterium]|nr:crossover junction endodeoxyribonuclease RuvC [Candidatus Schekmanbacteria bacterium]
MRVLGVDPGLTRTGYGVVEEEGSRYRAVAYGVVAPPRDGPLAERLGTIYRGIEAIIATTRPDEFAVEALFFARNPMSAFRLGQARGAALMAAINAGLSFAEYPPATVKVAVVGRGGARKEQVAHMVRMLLGLPADQLSHADVSDALAIAICHLHHAGARLLTRGAVP